jgi:polyferredoxin
VLVYFALWSAIGVAMTVSLATRADTSLTVIHDRAPLFTTLSDGSVRNGYDLKIVNKATLARTMTVGIEGLADAVMWTAGDERRGRTTDVVVPPDAVLDVRVFVLRPAEAAASAEFTFVVAGPEGGEATRETARFEAKERPRG